MPMPRTTSCTPRMAAPHCRQGPGSSSFTNSCLSEVCVQGRIMGISIIWRGMEGDSAASVRFMNEGVQASTELTPVCLSLFVSRERKKGELPTHFPAAPACPLCHHHYQATSCRSGSVKPDMFYSHKY